MKLPRISGFFVHVRRSGSSRVYLRHMATASDRSRRLVVLISGSGSNLQAVLDACADGTINGSVVAVISNRADAFGLRRAIDADVPAIHLGPSPNEPRPDYDARLADAVERYEPDLVVLAGWMRILTSEFLGRFADRVINLHPARPGELPGTRAIERAWKEALAGERSSSGVMVHFVPDEGVDDGPVIATVDVPIRPDDTLDAFEQRVHAAEHELLVATIADLSRELPLSSTPH